MTAPTLPPCPCCGVDISEWSHDDKCIFSDWLRPFMRIRKRKWTRAAPIMAAGIRATGAQVHGNYEKWEQQNEHR